MNSAARTQKSSNLSRSSTVYSKSTTQIHPQTNLLVIISSSRHAASRRSPRVGTHAPIYRHKPYITGISIKIGARFIPFRHSLAPIVHTDPRILCAPRGWGHHEVTESVLAFKGRGPTRPRVEYVLYRARRVVNHVFGNGRLVGPDVMLFQGGCVGPCNYRGRAD